MRLFLVKFFRRNLLTAGANLLVLFPVLGLTTTYGQEIPASFTLNSIITPNECTEDLQILRASFEEGHAGYTRYASAEYLNNLFISATGQCKFEKREWEFFRQVSNLSAAVKDGHTRVSLPESLEKDIDEKIPMLPLYIMVEGKRAIIYKDLRRETVPNLTGLELLSINGIQIHAILENLRQATAVDGDILSARDRRIEGWFFIRQLLTISGINAPFTVRLASRRDRIIERRIEGQSLALLNRKFTAFEKPISNLPPAELGFYDSSTIARLKIRRFYGSFDSKTAKEFPAFFQSAFEEIKKRKTRSLILDLRDNRGGDTELGPLLLSYLIDSPAEYYRELNTKSLKTRYLKLPENFAESLKEDGLSQMPDNSFRKEQPEIITPSESGFRGNLYVLQNGLSFSVSAEVLAILRHQKRAIFLGEESGGAYGGNTSGWDGMVILPHSGLRIRIPLISYYTAVGSEFALARGVFPDYIVGMSIKERLQKNDTALNLALRLAGKREPIKH